MSAPRGTRRICGRCRKRPARKGQGYCGQCHRDYMRDYRQRYAHVRVPRAQLERLRK